MVLLYWSESESENFLWSLSVLFIRAKWRRFSRSLSLDMNLPLRIPEL